jgi:hypothetical protein
MCDSAIETRMQVKTHSKKAQRMLEIIIKNLYLFIIISNHGNQSTLFLFNTYEC